MALRRAKIKETCEVPMTRTRSEILQSRDIRFFTKLRMEEKMRERRPYVEDDGEIKRPPKPEPKGGDKR